jgi:hypothetical protein
VFFIIIHSKPEVETNRRTVKVFTFDNQQLHKTRCEMIKLFSLKQQKKDGTDVGARAGQKKATAAQLRITKGSFGLDS